MLTKEDFVDGTILEWPDEVKTRASYATVRTEGDLVEVLVETGLPGAPYHSGLKPVEYYVDYFNSQGISKLVGEKQC